MQEKGVSRVRMRAFTLIELLIVVAIIGILAAIAVPNFLNAQTRAKVARARSELRSLAVAIDSYQLDQNEYPWPKFNQRFDTSNHIANCTELTTPISYIGSVDLDDPFITRQFWTSYAVSGAAPTYIYVNYHGYWGNKYFPSQLSEIPRGYGMTSSGPNKLASGGVHWPLEANALGNNISAANNRIYHFSNGLYSLGDIVRYGGSIQAPPMGGG